MNETPFTCAILAGGKSSRMGTDKSFVPLLGKPLVEHVLAQVEHLAEETIVVTNRLEAYAYLGLPLYTDIHPDHGPLGGLHTALVRAAHPHVLVAACDMPWLNRPLLEHLVSLRVTADAIVPRWFNYPEPLHAVYSKACLAPIEANLQAKYLKLAAFFEDVQVRFIEQPELARFDPEGRSFANVNTPEEIEAAARGRLPGKNT